MKKLKLNAKDFIKLPNRTITVISKIKQAKEICQIFIEAFSALIFFFIKNKNNTNKPVKTANTIGIQIFCHNWIV